MGTNTLRLAGYSILEAYETPFENIFTLRSAIEAPRCPNCGSKHHTRFGRRMQRARDLPLRGKPVVLYIETRRFKCLPCSTSGRVTFSERLPGIDARRAMTSRLVSWILREARRRTQAEVARAAGCTEGTVRQVLAGRTQKLKE